MTWTKVGVEFFNVYTCLYNLIFLVNKLNFLKIEVLNDVKNFQTY